MKLIDAAFAEQQSLLNQEVGVSDWITVDQAMIDQFAATTFDDQWIHTDQARAAETPFGGTIAHGFLTLSLASRFFYDALHPLEGQQMGVNYGFNKLRFLSPVPAGSLLRGRFELRQVAIHNDSQLLRKHWLTIEIQNGTAPALVAEWLTLTSFP